MSFLKIPRKRICCGVVFRDLGSSPDTAVNFYGSLGMFPLTLSFSFFLCKVGGIPTNSAARPMWTPAPFHTGTTHRTHPISLLPLRPQLTSLLSAQFWF